MRTLPWLRAAGGRAARSGRPVELMKACDMATAELCEVGMDRWGTDLEADADEEGWLNGRPPTFKQMIFDQINFNGDPDMPFYQG